VGRLEQATAFFSFKSSISMEGQDSSSDSGEKSIDLGEAPISIC